MTLDIAILLLMLAAIGIVLTLRFLLKRPKLRMVLLVLLCMIAVALAGYIVLTLYFVDAVRHQPPAP